MVASLWFALFTFEFKDPAYIISGFSIGTGFAISLFAFRLSIRHSQTKNIGKALLILGLAFIFYSTAESIFLQLFIEDISPYPSSADAFYFIYYLMLLYFVFIIFKTFIKTTSNLGIISVAISVIMIFVLYYVVSIGENMDYINLGGMFVVMSALIATSSTVIAVRLHNRGMKMIWITISIVMSMNAIADIWYYILENIGVYEYNIFIDTIWFAANLLLILLLLHFERYEKQIGR